MQLKSLVSVNMSLELNPLKFPCLFDFGRQVIMLLWTMVMAALSRSRRAFVNDGSLGANSEKPTNLKQLAKTCPGKLTEWG